MKRILALLLLLLLAGCRMMNTTVPTVPAAAASVSPTATPGQLVPALPGGARGA